MPSRHPIQFRTRRQLPSNTTQFFRTGRNLWIIFLLANAVFWVSLIVAFLALAIARILWPLELFHQIILASVVSGVVQAVLFIGWKVRCSRFPDKCETIKHHRAHITITGGLETILQGRGLPDVPFEPRLFRAPFLAVSFTGGMCFLSIALMPLFYLLIHPLLNAIGLIGPRFLGISLTNLWIAAVGAVAAAEAMNPAVIRVVPGKLEVLRFGTSKNIVKVMQIVDLSSASITVDLRTMRLLITKEREAFELLIAFIPSWREAIYYVLLGAASSFGFESENRP